MRALRVLALVIPVALAGCGPLVSGEWEDDPGNWARAYGVDPPPELHVVHSRYWRSAHFTYEAGYHFEIAPDPEVERQVLASRPTRLLSNREAEEAGMIGGPEWFTPRPASAYEVWVDADDPDGNFRVFVDRDTRALFLCDAQL